MTKVTVVIKARLMPMPSQDQVSPIIAPVAVSKTMTAATKKRDKYRVAHCHKDIAHGDTQGKEHQHAAVMLSCQQIVDKKTKNHRSGPTDEV